jgi:ribosomal protein S18 acetylase RimI-like enzyme
MKKKPKDLEKIDFVRVDDFDDGHLNNILMLEGKCFPKDWQYDNAPEYYTGVLKNKDNINIFLKKDNEVVGYILAIPHNNMVDDLLGDDEFLEKKDNFYYIETIQIIPQARGIGGSEKLLIAVCKEAGRRGISSFSIHARLSNGFADRLRKIFKGKISTKREMHSWKYGGGEAYEYIEWFC